MTALSVAAKSAIREAGLTLREYARSIGWADNAEGSWYGDSCGCWDDRCVGHHHDVSDDCGCLPVLIGYALEARRPPSEGGRTMGRASDATVRVIGRFRAQGLRSCASLGFEQADLRGGLVGLTGGPSSSWKESQVLVRHNVDDDDLAIVYVQGPIGSTDDLAVLDAAIVVLQDARHELARFHQGIPS